ncbi:MAG: BatD family protein [Aestuariibacter sp.]
MKFAKHMSRLIYLLLMLPLYLHAAPTEVVATLDKNPITVEESFQLQVVANDDVSADALDTSSLLKDFVVGRTSVSRQTQIINFDTSKSTTWTTTLIPRKAGQFTIPALSIAGLQTAPINLMVLPVSASKSAQGRDLFITTEVDLNEVYLQQQIRYTVKLHLAMDLQRGSLSAPEVNDADIEQVGNDKEYSEIVDGKRYRIIERTFSIIPNKSGEFVIQGPYFEGEVVDASRQSFGFFNRTKNVNRVGRNIDITVLPMPQDHDHHWLPSEFVQLSEEWQPDSDQLTVGTPVTRTITLTAVGVVESQLPEIQSAYPEQIKSYPDQANTATAQRNGTFVAQRTETIALIPNEDGSFTVPEVVVPWFNVVTRKTEFAMLPEKTISVTAAVNDSQAVPTPIETVTATPPQLEQDSINAPVATLTERHWWSMSSWVLLVLWMITLAILFWQRHRQRPSGNAKGDKIDTSADNNWQSLRQALKNASSREVGEVQSLLRNWLATYCNQPNGTLYQLLESTNDAELQQEVNKMLQSTYSQNSSDQWQPRALLVVLERLNKQSRTKEKQQFALKPLYE